MPTRRRTRPTELGASLVLRAWVVACLAVSLLGYILGSRRLWSHAGPWRGLQRRHVAAFAGGWLALVAALVSLLDPLGVQLFSAHMLHTNC